MQFQFVSRSILLHTKEKQKIIQLFQYQLYSHYLIVRVLREKRRKRWEEKKNVKKIKFKKKGKKKSLGSGFSSFYPFLCWIDDDDKVIIWWWLHTLITLLPFTLFYPYKESPVDSLSCPRPCWRFHVLEMEKFLQNLPILTSPPPLKNRSFRAIEKWRLRNARDVSTTTVN